MVGDKNIGIYGILAIIIGAGHAWLYGKQTDTVLFGKTVTLIFAYLYIVFTWFQFDKMSISGHIVMMSIMPIIIYTIFYVHPQTQNLKKKNKTQSLINKVGPS